MTSHSFNLTDDSPIQPLGATRSNKLSDSWVIKQIHGHHVIVIGGSDTFLPISLVQKGCKVTVYDSDPLGVKQDLAQYQKKVTSLQNSLYISQANFSQLNSFTLSEEQLGSSLPGGISKLAGTVVIREIPKGVELRDVIKHVRSQLGKRGFRLVVTLPGFGTSKPYPYGQRIESFLAQVRSDLTPEHLSIKGEELRFVGQFVDTCDFRYWHQFESQVWPDLVNEVVRSLQIRHHQGLSLDRQRLQRLRSSLSYRAGQILITSMKEPWRLWQLPIQLWRLYQSMRFPHHLKQIVGPMNQSTVEFPPLDVFPPKKTGHLVVATILDIPSEYCLRYEVDIVGLTPQNWQAELEHSPPAFLLVESAWAGNNGAWKQMISYCLKMESNPLHDLLRYCHKHHIPTVFWNREDPLNFAPFIDAAKQFDIVFTSDADGIPNYKEICGHDRIYALPLAVQPCLHNPYRESFWPHHAVGFFRGWVKEDPHIIDSLSFLLNPALQFGLHIFDSYLGPREKGNIYPTLTDDYQEAFKGTLNYKEMLTAYRCYDVFLNPSRTSQSSIRLPHFVLESLACGTPVVSNDSTVMNGMLSNYINVTRCAEETTDHLNLLLNDEEVRTREGHLAYRYTHEHHTYRHRMDEILNRVGLKQQETPRPSVSVILATCRPSHVAHALESFTKQSYQKKELLLVLNNASFDMDVIRTQIQAIPHVRVLQIEGRPTLATCLNQATKEASGEYIAKMDDDDYYGERYLSDMMLAASFSGAEILGKGTYFAYVESNDRMILKEITAEHQYTNWVAGPTLIIRSEVLKHIPFPNRKTDGTDLMFLKKAYQANCHIYSADRFNHINVRRADPSKHTWKIETAKYLKKSHNIGQGMDLSRVMI